MSDMGGMRQAMPVTFWTFIIGSLALAGFPLTAGFFSKDEILIAGDLWAGAGFPRRRGLLGRPGRGVRHHLLHGARVLPGLRRGEPQPPPTARVGRLDDHPARGARVPVDRVGLPALSPFSPDSPNFETWTPTEFLEDATYPFIEDGDHGAEEVALGVSGDGVLASGGPDGRRRGGRTVHGPARRAQLAPDLLAIVLLLFAVAVGLAYRFYGKGSRSGTRPCSSGR
jgi:hypothetical protein